jgi:hypothetical protein
MVPSAMLCMADVETAGATANPDDEFMAAAADATW